MAHKPLDLDAIDAVIRNAAQLGADIAPETAAAMAAEIRHLRARIAELEGPAVEARAALAALCYDLEDPGTAALGALYLISRATTGIEAPRDDATEALAKHDADVIRKAAQVLEETDRDDDAVNLLYLLADTTEKGEKADVAADGISHPNPSITRSAP